MPEPERRTPVRPGEPLPEFSGTTESGRALSRADLLGRPVVVFFYPKAGSAGCSMEAREFARAYPRFQAAHIQVVGVSVDPPDAQRKFREECGLPFDLIADRDRTISRRFGVLGAFGMARRTTFLVGADGTVVAVIRTWRPGRHPAEAVAQLLSQPPDPSSSGSPPPPR